MLNFICGFIVGVIFTLLVLSVFGLATVASDYDRAIDNAFSRFD